MEISNQNMPEFTLTVGGKHSVPPGVAVEELCSSWWTGGGKRKLANQCPAAVCAILEAHNLVSIYETFVQAVVGACDTKQGAVVKHQWNDEALVALVRQHQPQFASGGLQVALCRRTSSKGTHRWLEFIDTTIAPSYVPQYDVGNLQSRPGIKTICSELFFPQGVVVEQLDHRSGTKTARGKLQDTVPTSVEELLTRKGLMPVYNAFVYELADTAGMAALEQWDTSKLKAMAATYRPLFAAKGVDVHVSEKRELVSHGYHGGGAVVYRWLEFVDRRVQPNYVPQRGVEKNKKGGCAVM